MMKGFCIIIVCFNPEISAIDIFNVSKSRDDEISRKGSFIKERFEGVKGKGICRPVSILIFGDHVIKGDSCGINDGTRKRAVAWWKRGFFFIFTFKITSRVKNRLNVRGAGSVSLRVQGWEEVNFKNGKRFSKHVYNEPILGFSVSWDIARKRNERFMCNFEHRKKGPISKNKSFRGWRFDGCGHIEKRLDKIEMGGMK